MRCGISRNCGVYMSVGVTRPQDRSIYSFLYRGKQGRGRVYACRGIPGDGGVYAVRLSRNSGVYMPCRVTRPHAGQNDIQFLRRGMQGCGRVYACRADAVGELRGRGLQPVFAPKPATDCSSKAVSK